MSPPQKTKTPVTNITGEQMEQILELNSKAIEIYLEVNTQYTDMSKKIDSVLEKSCDHIEFSDKIVEKISENLSSVDKKFSEDHKNITQKVDALEKKITLFEQMMFKQNIAIITQLIVIIAMVVGKLLLGL